MPKKAEERVTPKENPLILYYGDSGIGKTVAALACLPDAEFIAAPGALIPAETVLGFKLRPAQVHSDVRTLDDVIAKIEKSSSKALVADDLTVLADQTAMEAQAKLGADRFAAWDYVLSRFMLLREKMRYKGMLFLANAHLKEPTTNDGRIAKGTVDFPGSGRKKFPAAFEGVYHCEQRQRVWGWPTVVRMRPVDREYTSTKDRLNVVVDGCPLNLAEILRVYGIECPRIPILNTQPVKDLVDQVAALLVDSIVAKKNDDIESLLVEEREALSELDISSPLHQDWVLRDTFDRAEIAVLRERAQGSLFRRKK